MQLCLFLIIKNTYGLVVDICRLTEMLEHGGMEVT